MQKQENRNGQRYKQSENIRELNQENWYVFDSWQHTKNKPWLDLPRNGNHSLQMIWLNVKLIFLLYL